MKNQKILIVEDEQIIAEDIRKIVENYGYQALEAVDSASAAISMTEKELPDLVLMDIMLKGSDEGIEAAKEISRRFDIPVIFITSFPDHYFVKEAKKANPYGYILKPFGREELAINIEMSLERHNIVKKLITIRENLSKSEEKYRTLVNNVTLGVFRSSADNKGYFQEANPALVSMLGYGSIEEFLKIPIIRHYTSEDDRLLFLKKIKENGFVKNEEMLFRKKDNTLLWVSANARAEYSEDGKLRWIDGVLEDITERKKTEDTLRSFSFIDELTKLFNRRGFTSNVIQQMKIAKRKKENMLLVFLDMDNMKEINDMYGHKEGDAALLKTAKIMKLAFRDSDILSRLGGDEFAAVMINASDSCIKTLNERIGECTVEVNRESKSKYDISLSWGIVEYKSDSNIGFEELLSEADNLMYRHKKSKKKIN